MSDRSSDQPPVTPRKLVPCVNPLESRLLLSQQVFFPDGFSHVFPTFIRLPRTGGVALQSGTTLTVGVGQRTTNTVLATLDGVGGAQVEWNGRPVHSFTGVEATLVQIGGASRDEVTFHLTNPRTRGTAIAIGQLLATPALGAKTVAHPVHPFRRIARTSGTAVQSGSLLTISVTAPKINTVEISSLNFGQVVQAEWNGGAIHNFSGVSTIIVDIKNGTNDLVGLHVASD